jgi:hypothetical protein
MSSLGFDDAPDGADGKLHGTPAPSLKPKAKSFRHPNHPPNGDGARALPFGFFMH